jgi:hypothetical protein
VVHPANASVQYACHETVRPAGVLPHHTTNGMRGMLLVTMQVVGVEAHSDAGEQDGELDSVIRQGSCESDG